MSRVEAGMDREELIKLKLQMGLSPFVDVDPQDLRSMWRQVCLERLHARREQGCPVHRDHAARTTLFDD